jgi:hypothetical protein
MFSNLARPSMHCQRSTRLTQLALFRLAVTLGLTVFDWYAFHLTRLPDVAPYVSQFERSLLPVLFAGMLAILLHLWVLTLRTFRVAIRTRNHDATP